MQEMQVDVQCMNLERQTVTWSVGLSEAVAPSIQLANHTYLKLKTHILDNHLSVTDNCASEHFNQHVIHKHSYDICKIMTLNLE